VVWAHLAVRVAHPRAMFSTSSSTCLRVAALGGSCPSLFSLIERVRGRLDLPRVPELKKRGSEVVALHAAGCVLC
jgi:hypothetical protein